MTDIYLLYFILLQLFISATGQTIIAKQLSSLHISSHHCIFCASLHVKTSPGIGGVHCQWTKKTVMERNDHRPSHAEAKKTHWLTLQNHGCNSDSFKEHHMLFFKHPSHM